MNNTLPILMLVAGGLLIYSAVKNRSPISVIQETLSGTYAASKSVPKSQATSTGGGRSTAGGRTQY